MDKLRVFLSWSGNRSRAVAEALRDWMPFVLNAVDPWMSAEDIEAGAKWQGVVSGRLQDSNFSIICLSPENLSAPWILFEAGSLSKHEESRVCTYLFDLGYEDVKPPLSQFQHTRANQEGTRKLVVDINRHLGDAALPPDRLGVAFEKWWPDLQAKLAGVPPSEIKLPKQSDPDKLSGIVTEILNTVREHSRLLQQMAARAEAGDVAQASAPKQSDVTTGSWWFGRFRALLESRGHVVALWRSATGAKHFSLDNKKSIPFDDAREMWNTVHQIGLNDQDQARMLEDLVSKYPVENEISDQTPSRSDI
jgi:hypothetical protein